MEDRCDECGRQRVWVAQRDKGGFQIFRRVSMKGLHNFCQHSTPLVKNVNFPPSQEQVL